MAFLIEAAALFFYAIAACALAGAIIVQFKFMSEVRVPLQALIWSWKAIAAMPNFQRVFVAPGQIKRFAIFALLVSAFAAALVTERSIELGHLPH